ncbi:hypothetical protein [Streptomyces sp. NPDC057616]|uniref:hypothetical protein n=1 Tax=Streptomyces sp. NPDC057616 TaxID=3346183 RepID=UPI0036B57A8A
MGRMGWGIPVTLTLLVLTGCTSARSDGGHASVGRTPVETTSSGHPSAAASRAAAEPQHAPELLDAQRTFVAAGGQTGSHSFSPISHIRRGTLEVAVVCSGSGTVDVNVGSLVSYTAVCAPGDPGQYDEVGLSRGHEDVAVSVTSKTSGSWALSVGWTENVTPRG